MAFFFEPYKRTINHLDETFTTKERKKEFNQIFNEKIIPFVKKYGFERHTKTSKRLFRKFENGLSCFILFEHKRFGYGSYEVSVIYFDEDIGNYLNDRYLATIAPKFPYATNLMIDSQNKELLNFEVHYWMRIMELYMFPFIAKNTTHKDILKTIENKNKIDRIRNELNIPKMAWGPIYYFDLPYSYSEREEIWSKNKKYMDLLKDKSNINNS